MRPYRSIAGKDSKAAVYDALSGSYLFKISASAEIKSMRFSRDGTSIGIACRNKLKALTLWPGKPDFSEEHLLNDGDELYTKKLKKGANCLDFSPCGTMVVVGCDDTKVRILRPGAGRVCYQKRSEGRVFSGSVSNDGKMFAFVSSEDADIPNGKKMVEVIDIYSGRAIRQIPGNKFRLINGVVLAAYSEVEYPEAMTDFNNPEVMGVVKSRTELIIFCGGLRTTEHKPKHKGFVSIRRTSDWKECFLLKFPQECRALCANESLICIAMEKHVEILKFKDLWTHFKENEGTTILMPKAPVEKEENTEFYVKDEHAQPEYESPRREGEEGEELLFPMTYSHSTLKDLIMSVDLCVHETKDSANSTHKSTLVVFGGLDSTARVLELHLDRFANVTDYDSDHDLSLDGNNREGNVDIRSPHQLHDSRAKWSVCADKFRPIERQGRIRATNFNHKGDLLAVGGMDYKVGLYEVNFALSLILLHYILHIIHRALQLTLPTRLTFLIFRRNTDICLTPSKRATPSSTR